MYESGFQCVEETLEPTGFCEAHQKVLLFERLEDSAWRKAVVRFVAFILLLVLFLIPVLYTLKDLYNGPRVRVQEGW
jgi:hypothetical protein